MNRIPETESISPHHLNTNASRIIYYLKHGRPDVRFRVLREHELREGYLGNIVFLRFRNIPYIHFCIRYKSHSRSEWKKLCLCIGPVFSTQRAAYVVPGKRKSSSRSVHRVDTLDIQVGHRWVSARTIFDTLFDPHNTSIPHGRVVGKPHIIKGQDRNGRTNYRPVIKAPVVDVLSSHPDPKVPNMDSTMETTAAGTLETSSPVVHQVPSTARPVPSPPPKQLKYLDLLSWVVNRMANRVISK